MARDSWKRILVVVSFLGIIAGLIGVVWGLEIIFNDNNVSRSQNRNTMTTVHATQYKTNAEDALNSDTPTKFWAMFMPTLTEDPTDEHSHARQTARADMCLKCHGSEEKACNPHYGTKVEDLKPYATCMSKTSAVNNALKCNAESLHFNIIEPNERTSLGFTGSARAQTLYATISLGVGFCLLFTSMEVFSVFNFFPTEADNRDKRDDYFKMIWYVKFFCAILVTFLFLYNTIMIPSEKHDLEISADYITKHGEKGDKIYVNWNEIDNTDIYCLLFLLILIATLMGRKSHMYAQAVEEKIADRPDVQKATNDAEVENGTKVEKDSAYKAALQDWVNYHMHEYNDSNTGRSAIDLGIVFAFQFYIWYALVQNNRVVLDTMLQKQLVAGAAIGIVYLLSTEICTALFSVRHLRAVKNADGEVQKEPLIAWHAAVITLASTVFIFFFYFFALYEDIINHGNDDDSNVLQTVFALLIVVPQALQLVYCLTQAFGFYPRLSFAGFQVSIDVLKVGLLAGLLITFHGIIQNDTRSHDLLDGAVKSSCTGVEGCNEAVFKFRASSWMRDIVSLSNDKKATVNAGGQTMHAYFCKMKLYPSYNCLDI